jgi:hypothetical protein
MIGIAAGSEFHHIATDGMEHKSWWIDGMISRFI